MRLTENGPTVPPDFKLMRIKYHIQLAHDAEREEAREIVRVQRSRERDAAEVELKRSVAERATEKALKDAFDWSTKMVMIHRIVNQSLLPVQQETCRAPAKTKAAPSSGEKRRGQIVSAMDLVARAMDGPDGKKALPIYEHLERQMKALDEKENVAARASARAKLT